jgi:DNA-binding transcriptional ArsR family regulator
LGLRFTPPVAPDDAAALYRRYAGDLRNFLRLLSNAVQRTPVVGRPAPLTARAAVQTMAEPYRRALAQRLGEVDLAHLAALADGGGPGLRVRPADVAQRTGLAKGSVTELLARLEAKGAVRYDRTEGRNTYYRLRPDTEIAFGLI